MTLAAPAIVRSERYFSQIDWAKVWTWLGKQHNQRVASYIDDLAALRKAIWLCPMDERKFNARRYGYGRNPRMKIVRGRCDACNDYHDTCSLFLPREQWGNIAVLD